MSQRFPDSMTDQFSSDVEVVMFLPGASGLAHFWKPIIDKLPPHLEYKAFNYPGFGPNPPDPGLTSLPDLADWIESYIDRPVALVAQSMGGVIAMELALRSNPLVRRLALIATSGGASMERFKARDWRSQYRAEFPGNPSWFIDNRDDLCDRLSQLSMPCLLIFASLDPVAPLAFGRQLSALLPDAQLVTVDTSNHAFAQDRPDLVAPHLISFLASAEANSG